MDHEPTPRVLEGDVELSGSSPQPYQGPRPSPARRWVYALVPCVAVALICSATLCVLNLRERHYQQLRLTSTPPSASSVTDTLDSIRSIGRISEVAGIATTVLLFIWILQRRSRSRRQVFGESSVEPSLWRATPRPLLIIIWASWAIAIGFGVAASSSDHVHMLIRDFVHFRTLVAAGDAARVVYLTAIAILVILMTRRQRPTASGQPHPEPTPSTPCTRPRWLVGKTTPPECTTTATGTGTPGPNTSQTMASSAKTRQSLATSSDSSKPQVDRPDHGTRPAPPPTLVRGPPRGNYAVNRLPPANQLRCHWH